MNHLSLFSGIGGLDLAAEWAGIQTVGQCEIDEYCQKILKKHWPQVPKWNDIRRLTEKSFFEKTKLSRVDIISGGFPCQPFSVAGKRKGKEDERYLWGEMFRVIKELQPDWVVGENVPGIINLALEDILIDLEGEGFETRTFVFPACAVGAWHRRYRVAIVGNRQKSRGGRLSICQGEPQKEDTHFMWPGKTVSDAKGNRQQGNRTLRKQELNIRQRQGQLKRDRDVYDIGQRAIESGLDRMANGISHSLDRDLMLYHYFDSEPNISRVTTKKEDRTRRIKCLGNAVVPQQFFPVFQAIRETCLRGDMTEVGDGE